MTLPRPIVRAVLVTLLPAFMASAAWADISGLSTDTDASSGVADSFDALSTDTSDAAAANNAGILQSRVDVLKAQISTAQRTGTGQDQIAQMQATSSALQNIITKLKQGYTVTKYVTSTDASTQVTTITITFRNTQTGNEVTQTSYIPPLNDSRDESGSGSDDGSDNGSNSSGGSESADMLTQILQQFGMQQMASQLPGMANPLTSGGNPMSAVQTTLDNLVKNNGATAPVSEADQCASKEAARKGVAVYDVAAGKVYMPDGTVLDAHSGMGAYKDNPDSVNQVGSGATPPNVYNVGVRAEGLYHGVEAVRLTPVGGNPMYGRDGFLAHSKLVRGAQNGSHGCVAFDDYGKFLSAFKNGQVKQLVVVPRKAKDKEKTECTPPTVNTPNPQSKGTNISA